MAATIQRTSTTDSCWGSREPWRRRSCTFYAGASWAVSSTKQKKGELRFPLPVGFCYDEEGRTILDPDEEVRGAVALVFRLFRETGSAYGVMHQFTQRGLRFPKRAYGGAWNGKIIWGRLCHGRVLCMLRNPSYAGMYVFGRYQYRQEISPEGEIRKRMQAVAMPAWRVSLKEHQNAKRLEKTRTNGEETLLS